MMSLLNQRFCQRFPYRNNIFFNGIKRYQSIYVFGTFDTKGDETLYLGKQIKNKLLKYNDTLIDQITTEKKH